MQPLWIFLEPSADGHVRRSYVGEEVRIANDKSAAVIHAAAGAPWASVYPRVLPAKAGVRFEVERR